MTARFFNKGMVVIEYPFGKNWTCMVCEAEYPDDFEPNECPTDGGHLHRVAASYAKPGVLPSKDEKMTALRAMHDAEEDMS